MSSRLKFLISSRANYRGQINTIYSDSSNIGGKSASDRVVLKTKIDNSRRIKQVRFINTRA